MVQQTPEQSMKLPLYFLICSEAPEFSGSHFHCSRKEGEKGKGAKWNGRERETLNKITEQSHSRIA
jgi:hypothetical protein